MAHLPPTTWVTTDEVMRHLQIKSANTITRLIREGMPAHRVGKGYRFDLHEVDEWVRTYSRWSARVAARDAAS